MAGHVDSVLFYKLGNSNRLTIEQIHILFFTAFHYIIHCELRQRAVAGNKILQGCSETDRSYGSWSASSPSNRKASLHWKS